MSESPPLARPARRRLTIQNLLYQLAVIGLMIVQGFLLVPLYLRHIDPAVYGAWLASGNVIAWIGLIDPDTNAVARMRTSLLYGKGERAQIAECIGTGLVINIVLSLLFVAAALAVSPLLPRLLHIAGTMAARPAVVSFVLAVCAEGLILLSLAAESALTGLMVSRLLTGGAFVASSVAGICGIVFLIHRGYGVYAIPLGLMIRGALAALSHAVLLIRYLRKMRLAPRFARRELRELLTLSGYNWLAKLSARLAGDYDAVLISRYLGAAVVPIYTLTKRPVDVIDNVSWRLSEAFIPGLAHVYGEGDLERLRAVSIRLARVVAWSSAILIGSYVALDASFTRLWVGTQWFGGSTLALLLGLAIACDALAAVLGRVLFATNRVSRVSTSTLLTAAARLVIMVLLFRGSFGLKAPPIAAVVAGVAGSLWLLGGSLVRMLQISSRQAAGLFVELGATILVCIALGVGFARWLPAATSWGPLVAMGAMVLVSQLLVVTAISVNCRNELVRLWARLKRSAQPA